MRPPSHCQTEDRRPDKSKSLSARTRATLGHSASQGRAARAAALLGLFSAILTILHAPALYAWPAGGRAAAADAAAPFTAPAIERDFASGFFSAALFQLASESVQTYAADCETPKDDFTLGDTMCVKASVPFSFLLGRRNINIIGPANVVRASISVSDLSLSQTLTFTIPTTPQTMIGDESFDNRGTWRADLSTVSGSRRASAYFDVSALTAAADLQIISVIDGDDTVASGDPLSVTVYVINMGPSPATNVVVTPPTHPGLALQSFVYANVAPPNNACDSPCTVPTLGRRDVVKFTATYNVTAAAGSKLVARSSLTSETPDPRPTFDYRVDDQNPAPPANTNADSISVAVVSASNTPNPTCTLTCPANITVDNDPGLAGANVNYPDATASDGCGELTTNHPEDPQTGTAFFPIGTTTVTITGGDDSSCSFVVTVLDKRAVTIALNGSAEMTVDCDASFTDPGASATDGTNSVPVTAVVTVPSGEVDQNGDSIPTVVAGVNTSAPGDYTITYTATKDNFTATATRIVHVVAGSLPVITLANTDGFTPQTVQITDTDDNGNPIVVTETILVKTIECGSAFTPPTATAVSSCGNTPVPVTTTGAVDANTPGTYEITYSAVGNTGNGTETRVRVTVADTTAPVITLNGDSPMTVECHTAFNDPGATAADGCEGPVNVNASGSVNPDVVGTYVITYTATDSGGRTTTATRTVNVVDTTAPAVTLNGPAAVTVECHTSYTDAGASVADACDSTTPLTSTSDVNVNVPGTYQVTYSATDDSNNTGTATRTVTVVDTIAPTVTLNGPALVTIILGSSFVDPGATAADSCAGSVPVTVSGAVNNHAVGTYVLTYTATDPSGNAGSVTRTVKVIYDFSGFFSPVNNLPTLNQMNAGRSIPVKFSLAGNQGLGIMAAGSPYSQQVNCNTSAPVADIEATDTPGGSTLTYDAGSDQYSYNWKTEKSWAGQCRVLTVELNDGTTHTAAFKFK